MLIANTKQSKKPGLHKIKKRRRMVAIILAVLFFIFILYMIFHARNYEKSYIVDEFKITEKFDKDLKTYSFEVSKDNQTWHFVTPHKYISKHRLLSKIDLFATNETTCIIPESGQLDTYPQCIKNGVSISYHLLGEEEKSQLDAKYFPKMNEIKSTYEKIDIKNIDNNTYYIWNYKGFYVINQNTKKNISFFNKDIYDLKLVSQVDNFIVIPDYNSDHYFNKFFLLNTKDDKSKTWEFKDSLYFDGYFLGQKEGSLFYVDKKEKIEWEISPSREKMRKVGTSSKDGKIYQNEWKKISMTKLVNETLSFKEEMVYHYEIENGLYVKYLNCENRKQISNLNVKSIVKVLNDKVYYLVGESLYYYSEKTGEVLVMSYFEWNFNHQNMIFIVEN